MNASTTDNAVRAADVAIIGGGVIGLSTALELGREGASCLVLTTNEPGAASGAAAGLLAPSIRRLTGTEQAFYDASLAAYPDFVSQLQEYDPALELSTGLLEIDPSSSSPEAVGTTRLTQAQVALREPAVHAPEGALFHANDAAIDNVRLMRALRAAASASPRVTVLEGRVNSISSEREPTIECEGGLRISAATVVLAAGAWSPGIRGLPRTLPIRPLKGQMLAVESTALRGSLMGESVYLVPRRQEGEIVIGATVEEAGFDLTVHESAIEALHANAAELCPELARARVVRSWAGTRPATPDLFPIIGADPDVPSIVYACGHSKNGILLAPATARFIASLVLRRPSGLDASPFSVERFADVGTGSRNR